MSKLLSVHKRMVGLGLLGAAMVVAIVLGALWTTGQLAQAHAPTAEIRIVAVNGVPLATPVDHLAVPRDAVVLVCNVNDSYGPPDENVDHYLDEYYDVHDSTEADTQGSEYSIGLNPSERCVEVSSASADHTGGRTTVGMNYTDTQGTVDTQDDTYDNWSNNVFIFWLSIRHLDYQGNELEDPVIDKPSSYHRIVTEGFQLHGRYANCNDALTDVGTLPCWRWEVTNADIIDRSALNGMDEAARGFLCEPDGTPVTGAPGDLEWWFGLELCVDIHSDIEADSTIVLHWFEPTQMFALAAAPEPSQPDDHTFNIAVDTNTLNKSWVEDPVDILHVNPDGTDQLAADIDADGFYEPVDGDVYESHDENNITSMQHLIRTAPCDGTDPDCAKLTTGWQPNFVVDELVITNTQGADATITGGPELCGTITIPGTAKKVSDLPNWDPDANPATPNPKDSELCIFLHSAGQGESQLYLRYHDEGAENDGDDVDEPDDSAINSTNTLVKEWDKLHDTVILKAEPTDANGDGVIDQEDHHLLDQQDTVETDQVILDKSWPDGERLRSATGPVQLIEIVHGAHLTTEHPDWTDPVHHPTQGAVIYAEIESDNGCTYFTNPPLSYDWDSDGTPNHVHAGGQWNFGDAMFGRSNNQGRFVGPRIPPADSKLNDETIAEATAKGLISATSPLGTDAHTGTAPNGDPDTGEAWGTRVIGPDPTNPIHDGFQDIWVDTTCEENATITIKVGYPGSVLSEPQFPDAETIDIEWVTVEEAKQPQIRWAGEKIVLAKRWALPGEYYPEADMNGDGNIDVAGDSCPWVGAPVKYVKLDGPGGLIGEYSDEAETVWTYVDEECVSRTVYKSEEPGQVDVDAILYQPSVRILVDSQIDDLDLDSSAMVNEHGFVIWYLKIYQVKLTNVDGARAYHNDGAWDTDVLTASEDTADTLNVSQDALLKVQVKGYFFGGNQSGRGAVCIDVDGDGDGDDTTTDDVPGEPYPLAQYEQGCPDSDDHIVDHGHWVLPDDLPALAGATSGFTYHSWDVMHDIDETESLTGLWIGPKSTLDSHDPVGAPVWREVVPCVIIGTDGTPDSTCLRKTIDPDGEITEADAIMPPLKIRALISDPADAGFLKEADKDTDLGIDSLYQEIMIPADPEIPPIVNSGGYDWHSWDFEGIPALGPYEFYHLLHPDLSELQACDPDTDVAEAGPGPLCNADLGNQDDHRSDDSAHPRLIEFYSDNRGQGYFFANGDYNLDFGIGETDGCAIEPLGQAPDCDPDDVVGESNITAVGVYPYERKHTPIESNPVTKTWTWGGYKRVQGVAIDANHTAIIASLKDRDGYCKYDVDYPDITLSPSENPVQHEEITFILNDDNSIIEVSPYGQHSVVPHVPLADDTITGMGDGNILAGRGEATALAEDVRVLDGMDAAVYDENGDPIVWEDDECQAWVIVEHPAGEEPDVSIRFDDPEGTVTRHYPTPEIRHSLGEGWNDRCYVGDALAPEDALAGIEGDVVTVVWRYDNEDKEWQGWVPDRPGTITPEIETINPWDQLYILIDEGGAQTWTLDASGPPPDKVSLLDGWNSVCYVGKDKDTDAATASIEGQLQAMYTLTGAGWLRYFPGRIELNNLLTLRRYDSVMALVDGDVDWLFDP